MSCGTESWLKGVKPGKPPKMTSSKTMKSSLKIIMSLEMTEELLEGRIHCCSKNIPAVECADFVTSCEVDFAIITLKAKKKRRTLKHFIICHTQKIT